MRFLLLLFVLYAIALSVALAYAGLRSAATTAGGARASHPMRLLIVGANGGTGRHLVAQALQRGHIVTAFVRNPSTLERNHSQLTVVQGDVLDYASVEAAVRGQEAV